MDMSGEYRIPARRERVWAALNDPEVLKQAIPGCDELNKVSDTELEAKVTAKVGPVKARFGGNVRLENINAPVSYSIVGEGKGGAAGFAKGGADVSLAEDGDGTVLSYVAKAEVGGKLAQIGSRLIQGTSKKMADEFFGKFSQIVSDLPDGYAAQSGGSSTAQDAAGSVADRVVHAAGDAAGAVSAAASSAAHATSEAVHDAAEAAGSAADSVKTAASSVSGSASQAAPPASATTSQRASATATESAGSNKTLWIGAIIIVLILLYLFFGG
ncbi:MAG: carbon monoxide dehydrogenase subunit G [Geminicoccaceae bacterium]|nr:carbon monoxide dehydrogenase subunit G [Geminicoccaceae bacterium]MCB9942844.1 carbon monoxide dehydrogenase subunit G [Geminicoccaceae bacterium]